MEQALREYEKKRRENEKKLEKIRKKYNKRLEKTIKEILKLLNDFARKDFPKGVDERIKKVVEGERKSYVLSLQKALESIDTMEDLGKRLPDLSKFHVGHGKYLITVFEKEVYAINRLLKELSEEYTAYYEEVANRELREVDIDGMLAEEDELKRAIEALEEEKKNLLAMVEAKKAELEKARQESGLGGLEEEIERLTTSIKTGETEVRSKASKLQKPIKRMRLGGFADEFARDSSLALTRPEEFLSLLMKVSPRLDGKYKKTAVWLIENLPSRAEELSGKRKRLKELEAQREKILEETASIEKEIWELERLVEDKEEEIKKLKRRLEHLGREIEEAIKAMESVLGEEIER